MQKTDHKKISFCCGELNVIKLMLYKPRNLIFASALHAAKKKNDLEYPVHIFIKQKKFFAE